MKTLVEYIQEKQEDKIYVVKDRDGEILGLSEIEKYAKAEADEYNEKTPSVKAKVEAEKKSDYIKED
jgi:hypothetical protein